MNVITERDTDDEYVRIWKPDENERVLFVTYMTPDSATRYEFDIYDSEAKACQLSRGDNTTPPRTVVETLNDEGYTVSNLPNVSETDPLKTASQISEAITWLRKHGGFEPGDIRVFAYNRAENVTVTVEAGVLIMDIIGPDDYREYLQAVLQDAAQSGVSVSPDELLDPRTHSIEFLQNVVIEMRRALPREKQEEVAEIAESELGIGSGQRAEEHEATQSWEQTTQGEESYTVEQEALERLHAEGWLPE
jgi:hypothetical protein